jgi:hypothetical protein
MEAALDRLVRLVPPAEKPPGAKTEWAQLEAAIGLKYPDSFKEFAGVYGLTVWFDNFSPFFGEAKTAADAKKFLRSVQKRLGFLKGNMYDESFRPTPIPLYPAAGGLFPFGMDYSGNQYLWLTERADPDRWPIVVWQMGQLAILEKMTVAKMLLGFYERRKPMRDLWGDARLCELGGFGSPKEVLR